MYKVIIFSYLFWFVLTIIFITGTTRISIFCMGYLVACFYFLLFGGDLLLKPIRSILRYWDWLIAYNVFVITMKNILSVSSYCRSFALGALGSLEVRAVLRVVIKNHFTGPQPFCKCKAGSVLIQKLQVRIQGVVAHVRYRKTRTPVSVKAHKLSSKGQVLLSLPNQVSP